MKSQSYNLRDSTMTSSNSIINNENKKNDIFCSSSKSAIFLCMNQKCKEKVFLCENQDCKCQQTHKKCLKLKNSSLINHLLSKKVSIIDSFDIFITTKIQTIIDQLSNFRDNIINEIKEKFQFFGLNEIEEKLLKDLESNKCQNITGSNVWEIIHFPDVNEDIMTIVNQTYQMFQVDFENSKTNLSKSLNNISATLQKCNENVQKLFNLNNTKTKPIQVKKQKKQVLIDKFNLSNFTSNVVKTQAQYNILLNFFGSKIFKSAKLIYLASLNEFEIKKFHQKCDNIPYTLILLETNHGKKIGGYTPVSWKSPSNGGYVRDESMQSFLFSITQKDKFHLNAKQSAVYHYPKNNINGIAFGSGHDLCIVNKANKTQCRANIGSSYINEYYRYSSQLSWQRFSGSRASYNFLAKQWQVWCLQF